jgi:hypothetical protein
VAKRAPVQQVGNSHAENLHYANLEQNLADAQQLMKNNYLKAWTRLMSIWCKLNCKQCVLANLIRTNGFYTGFYL